MSCGIFLVQRSSQRISIPMEGNGEVASTQKTRSKSIQSRRYQRCISSIPNRLETMKFSSSFALLAVFVASVEALISPSISSHRRGLVQVQLSSTAAASVDEEIAQAMNILYSAAESKAADSDAVVAALLDLEQWSRKKNKENPALADATLEALGGSGGRSWRLVFTTGTVDTQKRTGRINYFPIKATQSFNKNADPWYIENGLYLGDFPAIKFRGDFDWTMQKSGNTKVTFDFSHILLFNLFDIELKKGEAASLGAKSGLGSKGNVNLEKQGKRAFFNWISADDRIATARGGGGGLALWKRVDYEGGQ